MSGKVGNFRRHIDLLDSNGAYFERAKPQYESGQVGDFVHVKDFGARGDGVTDNTAGLQSALSSIPVNSRIVVEKWSQLVKLSPQGATFQLLKTPRLYCRWAAMVRCKTSFFTTRGPTEGLIFVEWNVRPSASGSAGLWNCHVSVSGATGTDLTPAECPALTIEVAQGCNTGSLMMHIT
ncbi:hypothetical protein PspLS_08452 [Pyricularia sp. CBS 133598]|nr:hypothetical protein PspLS_08452 [Pyricularia sp. CBS 133598]